MTDLLFIELGAVVTEVKGHHWCTIEPYCDPNNSPTYSGNRVDVNFADSLDQVLSPANAKYDAVVTGGRTPIGPQWPGGGYEGILSVRENILQNNNEYAILWNAANTLAKPPAHRCAYQVIASVAGNEVRRYHGFWAQVVAIIPDQSIQFNVFDYKGNLIDSITCDLNPLDTVKFYAGNQVDNISLGNIIDPNVQVNSQGAVFINLEAFPSLVAPKQPPGAGL